MTRNVPVAVTEQEFAKARAAFEAARKDGFRCFPAPFAETELAAVVRAEGVRHVVVGPGEYSGELYDALGRGSVIARFGVGHDGIDKALAAKAGILCTNTPGVLDDTVAEYAMALVLAAARRVGVMNERTRSGCWSPIVGGELRGARLAVIGCGSIGRRLARIASFGFAMIVTGCEVGEVDMAQMRSRFGFESVVKDFAEAVKGADFVSLHIPCTEATRRFICAERIRAIPKSAWLINTARGAVVDEADLFDALSSGRLAGAALDVFETEPYVPVSDRKDLRALPNVIMTPHAASSTQQACDRMAAKVLRNISLALAGDFARMDLLNPDVLESLKGD